MKKEELKHLNNLEYKIKIAEDEVSTLEYVIDPARGSRSVGRINFPSFNAGSVEIGHVALIDILKMKQKKLKELQSEFDGYEIYEKKKL